MSKLSNYNFFIKHENKTVCFNAISRFVFALNEKEFAFLQNALLHLDQFEVDYPSYFAFLKSKYFIADDNLNEYNYIRYRHKQDIFLDNQYRVIINPTLECNFNCWYCYEEHPKGHMSPETMKRVLNHFSLHCSRKEISALDLSWFGGEPLLYFDEVVYPISKEAKLLMEKNHLNFSNHATTNGYLITPSMIEKFNEIDLTSFQITIDGNKNMHDKIRCEKGKPSFEKIMENICRICESNKAAHVLLRINYTDQTIENMDDILSYIPQQIKQQVSIGFHRVWQTVSEHHSSEKKEILVERINDAVSKGFACSYPESFSPQFISCYADRFWHSEINYDGSVYKCTMDYSQKPHGRLLEDGAIEWDRPVVSNLYGQASFDNEMCMNCKLLPICLGPCSRKFSENNNCPSCLRELCNMRNSEIGVKNIILNHYKYLLTKSQNNEFQDHVLSASI